MKEVNVVADKFFRFAVRVFMCGTKRVYFVQTITSKWNGNRCFDYQFSIVWLKQKPCTFVRIVGRRSPSGWENALLVGNGIVL